MVMVMVGANYLRVYFFIVLMINMIMLKVASQIYEVIIQDKNFGALCIKP